MRLPFEGDDTLSIILSKAFMLADDDKIKDASIISQIRGGSPRPWKTPLSSEEPDRPRTENFQPKRAVFRSPP